MESTIIRYTTNHGALKIFKYILEKARASTTSSPSCIGKKKLRIKIIVEEVE
jgi:hypothetical protein